MKKVVYLFLAASFLLLHSQELIEEAITSTPQLSELAEEKNALLSANELEGFKGEIAEVSSRALTEEKDLLVSAGESKKNGLYFFAPNGLSSFSRPGIAFRHHLSNRSFLEVSYFNEKEGDMILYSYTNLFDEEPIKKLGVIYKNVLDASYGLKWNMRYITPYFSFGAGLCLPYVQHNETSYIDLLPSITTALGFEFGYGFVDLAINYLPIKWTGNWTGVVEYQNTEYEYTLKHNMRLLGNLRIGVGFPF